MLKIRVQGLPDEVRAFCDAAEASGAVLERSGEYANRGDSRYMRVYLDLDAQAAARKAYGEGDAEGRR